MSRTMPLLLLLACADDTKAVDTTSLSTVDTGDPAPVDADGDGVSAALDCDDDDPTAHPGAAEACDGVDNDCDGETDEGYDVDLDGYTTCGGDCADDDPGRHPGIKEVCDGVDNNCDDQIDEGLAQPWYRDADGDGHGDAADLVEACAQPSGYIEEPADDCDDSDGDIFPGAEEVCNGEDDDCDGLVPADEGDSDKDGIVDCERLECDGTGMTWAHTDSDATYGADKVACSGCDPYSGDTDCEDALPLLCLYDGGYPNPGITTDYYSGWTGGDVALTDPLQGCRLTSLADADAICAATFGTGWRMGDFHAGGGGWGWWAYGSLKTKDRFWTMISDQPANCWN